jgi:hypothetical protein
LSVPDEGYCKNESCTLNLISDVFKQNLDKDDASTVSYIPYNCINIRHIFWYDFSKVHSVYCTSHNLIGLGLEILYIINIFLFISVNKEWKLILYLHFNRVLLTVFIVTLIG